MERLRMGAIGLGKIGVRHLRALSKVDEVQLVGVADVDPNKAQKAGSEYNAPAYTDHNELLKEQKPDFVLIATPHSCHPTIAIDAFKAGAHVLSEKPLAVNLDDADLMVAEADRYGKVLGVVFQQRTEPGRRWIHDLVNSGGIGEVYRTEMLSTWYRSQAYYDSESWRGTWAGEGGGVLFNQAPHDLDQFIWICGMPSRVYGMTETRVHQIEGEDSASALISYPNGARGHFHTSTVEFPEAYRLEVCGDRGKFIFDKKKLTLWRLGGSLKVNTRTTMEERPSMDADVETIEFETTRKWEDKVLRDFALALIEGRQPLATGEDGVRSLELAAAIMLSSHTGESVDLPVDRGAYARFFAEKCKSGHFQIR